MRYEDELWVCKTDCRSYDDKGYPNDPENEWSLFGKCFLSFNSAASKVRLADGKEYQYTYYVIAPLKKDLYSLIPKEGERVQVKKADGTVEQVKEVRGFVTYKKRYLKIWL